MHISLADTKRASLLAERWDDIHEAITSYHAFCERAGGGPALEKLIEMTVGEVLFHLAHNGLRFTYVNSNAKP